tara:strand:- start:5 stop:262 length:258 start_codon:yes stop_codon:yes gene_type:complete
VLFSSLLLFFALKAYIRDPTAIEVEANIPDIRIKAKRPPIKPPFNLSKLDFIKSISNKKVVAFREVIFMKEKGEKGFSIIKNQIY